jgi:hypothetical protein
MSRAESSAVAACREYEHWASEVRRLTDAMAELRCWAESDVEEETHWAGSESHFRTVSQERLDVYDGWTEEGCTSRRRTLEEVAAHPEVAACSACSQLVELIRARRYARKRYGVAKRAVRRAGKLALAPTPTAPQGAEGEG